MGKTGIKGHKRVTVGSVYRTTDFDRFAYLPGQRPVGKRHRRLARSIEEDNMLDRFPISVFVEDDMLYIIDGQHRFAAAQMLGEPIDYVIVDPITPEQICAAHSPGGHSSNWTDKEVIESHITNPHYRELREFHREHHVAVGCAIGMLRGHSHASSWDKKEFRLGRFKVTDRAWASRIVFLVNAFRDKGVSWAGHVRFLQALSDVMKVDGFDEARLIRNLGKYTRPIHDYTPVDANLQQLEDIYNHGVSKKKLFPLALEAKRAATSAKAKGTK